ncbi:MAG: patatin-like phospholipase family protein [Pseudomonadota bacterium]
MRRNLKSLLMAMMASVLATLVSITPQANADAPKIGLVLGGGGAAGVAHVGVIRELERLGIRPDVVTGTSMGAIIGGLYAAGYTPEDLERVALEIEWGSILNDSSNRRLEHPLRRDSRLEPLSVQADLPLGIGAGGVQLNAGLVDGVKLTAILGQLTARANRVKNFDHLPIPFRAVATDLATGQPVVLDTGPLVEALRASMSIPALFPPVERDGRLLVDGGVSNNLPIDVARAMGADIVIVSSIPPAEKTVDELGSFGASLGQTMSIFIHARTRDLIATLGEDDILLVPDVGSVGMLDFAEAPQTLTKGQESVAGQLPKLSKLASTREAIAEWPTVGDLRNAEISYDRIVIEYDGTLAPEVIRRRLGLAEQGTTSGREIEEAISRVYGLDLFENVGYRQQQSEGETLLVVSAERRNDGLARPRFGLALSDTLGEDGDFTIAIGGGLTELNPLGGRIDLDVSFGEVDSVQFRFEQPLDYDHTFHLRTTAAYLNRSGTVFGALDDPFSEITVDTASVGTELFWTPGDWGRVGLGLGFVHQTVDVKFGTVPGTNIGRIVEDQIPLTFSVDYDTLDDPDLPRSGIQVGAAYSYDIADENSPDSFSLDALAAYSIGQNTFSTFLFAEGEREPEGFDPRFIGGFQRLSGLAEGELLGNVVALAGLRYYRRFGLESPFGDEAFAGASLEYGGAFADWDQVGGDGSFVAGSLFAGVQTPFGPLMVGVGSAEQGQFASTISLGFRF